MALFKIFRKNPVKKLSSSELKEMEFAIRVKSDRLADEITEIEQGIQSLFEKSKQARSRAEEINLASRIRTLTQKKDMKSAAHAELEKELRAVSNMLIIKEHEADLREAGVWEPLEKIPPEELEKYLVERKLEAEDRQSAVKMISELTSSTLKPRTDYDEDLDDILAMMRQVKEGNLEPKEAQETITKTTDKEAEN